MSKIKLLLDVVSDMRSLADSIEAVADVIGVNENIEEQVKEPEQNKITLEEIRGVLAEKSQAGFTADVKELINKYGGNKLSEVDPKSYGDMLKDAEVLGNE